MGLRAIYECENCKAWTDAGDIDRSVHNLKRIPDPPWLILVDLADKDNQLSERQTTYCSLKCVADAGQKEQEALASTEGVPS